MGEFGLSHYLVLGVILLVFFGPSRLPALGQSLGKAIRGFKNGLNEIDAEAKDVTAAPVSANQASAAARQSEQIYQAQKEKQAQEHTYNHSQETKQNT